MTRGANFIDRTGQRFGRLMVLRRGVGGAPSPTTGKRKVTWVCACDCGTERDILANNLVSGTAKSCGCLAAEADRAEDLTAQVFGRLRVLARGKDIPRANGKAIVTWACVCDCGKAVEVRAQALKNGHTQSCGCLRVDVSGVRATKHGMKEVPEYIVWKGMRNRCNNAKCDQYIYYGARGIKVCDRWADFALFLADMGERPTDATGRNLTIDRINNDGDYEPGNCRWATSSQQNKNKRPRGTVKPIKAAKPAHGEIA
jgi:hypothetical protein